MEQLGKCGETWHNNSAERPQPVEMGWHQDIITLTEAFEKQANLTHMAILRKLSVEWKEITTITSTALPTELASKRRIAGLGIAIEMEPGMTERVISRVNRLLPSEQYPTPSRSLQQGAPPTMELKLRIKIVAKTVDER
jgi:hypothetical protein